MSCRIVLTCVGTILLGTTLRAQETRAQADALALLAKVDGQASFDPAHPKRVIGINL